MSRKANTDEANELHLLTFQLLIRELRRYLTPGAGDDGEKLPSPPIPPALFAQCLKALKDNGIDQPERAKQLQDALSGVLPDLDEVEQEHLQ